MPAGGRELQAVAHQVVEHLQQQIPIAPNPWQLGFALQLQRHPLVLGIEPVGAQGLLHRHLHLHRLQLLLPIRFQAGEIEHVVDEPGVGVTRLIVLLL